MQVDFYEQIMGADDVAAKPLVIRSTVLATVREHGATLAAELIEAFGADRFHAAIRSRGIVYVSDGWVNVARSTIDRATRAARIARRHADRVPQPRTVEAADLAEVAETCVREVLASERRAATLLRVGAPGASLEVAHRRDAVARAVRCARETARLARKYGITFGDLSAARVDPFGPEGHRLGDPITLPREPVTHEDEDDSPCCGAPVEDHDEPGVNLGVTTCAACGGVL